MKLANDIKKLYDTGINDKPMTTKWGPDATVTGLRGNKRIIIKRIKHYDRVFYKYRVESFQWSPPINIKQLQRRFDAIPRTVTVIPDKPDTDTDDTV